MQKQDSQISSNDSLPQTNAHSWLARWYWLYLSIISLFAALSVYYTTMIFGIGMSPDSLSYFEFAKPLTAGRLSEFLAIPIVLWPPLYPALLSLAAQLWAEPLVAARWLQILLYALYAFTCGLLFKHYFDKPLWWYVGTFLAIAAVPMAATSTMVWSELLFMLWVIPFLLLSDFGERYTLQRVLLLGILTACAVMTRYIGLVLIPTALLLIFLAKGYRMRQRIAHALLYTVVATLPFLLWIVRNYLISGTIFGPRATSTTSLLDNIALTVAAIATFWLPASVVRLPYITLLFGSVFLVLLGLYFWHSMSRTPLTSLQRFQAFWLYIVFYLAFLVYSSSNVKYEPINTRYVAPLYVPFLVILLSIAELFFFPPPRAADAASTSNGFQRAMRYCVAIVGVLFLLFTGFRLANSIVLRRENGSDGYELPAWQNDGMITFLRTDSALKPIPIYSNYARLLQILTDLHVETMPLPQATGASAEAWSPALPSYLLYFDTTVPTLQGNLQDLQEEFSLVTVREFDGVTLYEMAPRP
jgi:hypothetical protein